MRRHFHDHAYCEAKERGRQARESVNKVFGGDWSPLDIFASIRRVECYCGIISGYVELVGNNLGFWLHRHLDYTNLRKGLLSAIRTRVLPIFLRDRVLRVLHHHTNELLVSAAYSTTGLVRRQAWLCRQ